MGKKYISIVVIILLLVLSHKNYALAQEIEREELSIVFLMDHSGSMNSWDRQGMLHEIIKAFADTMYTGDCQIGYVAYNDRIVASHAPVSVQAREQIKGLKDSIDSVSYGGETDIGLGLILCDLFFSGFEYSVYEAGDNLYDEGKQKIGYENTGYSDSLVILLLSDKDIADASILYGAQQDNPQEIEFELSGKYATAMLNEPEGDFSISFDTVQKQKISTFVIGRHMISPQVEWEGTLYKNVPIDFRITFMNKNGETVKNLPYRAGWHGEFEDLQTGERIEAEITVDGQSLSGTALFPKSGNYALYLTPPGEKRSLCSITGIDVLNTLPGSSLSKGIDLLTISDEQTIKLNKIFSDSDGDGLTFELQNVPEKLIKAQVEGNELHIEPVGRGKGEIKLLVSDGEGSLTGSIPIRVRSLPEAYWQVLVGLLCIVLFCVFKIWKRKKYRH